MNSDKPVPPPDFSTVRKELIEILGESPEALKYIAELEGIIWLFSRRKSIKYLSVKDRQIKLDSISKHSKALTLLIQDLGYVEGEKHPFLSSDLIDHDTLRDLSDALEPGIYMTPESILNIHDQLKILSEASCAASRAIIPKENKGRDRQKIEAGYLARMLLVSYRGTFYGYPRISETSAFWKVVLKVNDLTGYKIGLLRLKEEIQHLQQSTKDKPGIPQARVDRRLHPNK